MFLALYFIFSLVVGLFAIGRGGGFLLYFLLSLVLSPLVSMVILLIATPRVVDMEGRPVRLGRRWG